MCVSGKKTIRRDDARRLRARASRRRKKKTENETRDMNINMSALSADSLSFICFFGSFSLLTDYDLASFLNSLFLYSSSSSTYSHVTPHTHRLYQSSFRGQLPRLVSWILAVSFLLIFVWFCLPLLEGSISLLVALV